MKVRQVKNTLIKLEWEDEFGESEKTFTRWNDFVAFLSEQDELARNVKMQGGSNYPNSSKSDGISRKGM